MIVFQLEPLARVEGRDGAVEAGPLPMIVGKSAVPHSSDDLTQLGAIGHNDEVNR